MGVAKRNRERAFELDLLRAVALAGVVLVHTLAWIVPSPNLPAYTGGREALLDLSRFCVPAFVFASGLALTLARAREAGARAFAARRWSRVAVPWLVWVPVFALLGAWTGQIPWSWAGAGSWLAYGGGHLYFLVLIAQLYAVFLFMPRSRRGLVLFGAVAIGFQVALGVYRTYLPQPQGPLGWPASQLAYEEAPFYAGYFAAGCIAGAYWDRLMALHRWWPVAAVAAALSAGGFLAESLTVSADPSRHGTYTFLWPAQVPFALGIGVLVLLAGRASGRALAPAAGAVGWVSRHGLGLYVVHPIVLDALGPRIAFLPAGLRVVALFVSCLAGAALAVLALRRVPWASLAIGEAAPPRALRKSPVRAAA